MCTTPLMLHRVSIRYVVIGGVYLFFLKAHQPGWWLNRRLFEAGGRCRIRRIFIFLLFRPHFHLFPEALSAHNKSNIFFERARLRTYSKWRSNPGCTHVHADDLPTRIRQIPATHQPGPGCQSYIGGAWCMLLSWCSPVWAAMCGIR